MTTLRRPVPYTISVTILPALVDSPEGMALLRGLLARQIVATLARFNHRGRRWRWEPQGAIRVQDDVTRDRLVCSLRIRLVPVGA